MAKVTAVDVAQSITVTVKLRKRRRFELGLWLIRLGCWISGLQLRVAPELKP